MILGFTPPPSLREIEFVENLIKLLEAHPDFDNILREPRQKSGRVIFRPDIMCQYQGSNLLIEAKGLGPVIERTLNSSVSQIMFYKQALPNIEKAVLAIPNSLQQSYKTQVIGKGIDVWDLDVLAKKFSNQLNVIHGSPLYELLIKKRHVSKPQAFVNRLRETPRGRENWSVYQKLVANIFEHLFTPPLSKPIYELSDIEGINRRDIILPNYCEEGF